MNVLGLISQLIIIETLRLTETIRFFENIQFIPLGANSFEKKYITVLNVVFTWGQIGYF